jgi:lipoprotein-anchoring transpeptidase ErfK/SrfK
MGLFRRARSAGSALGRKIPEPGLFDGPPRIGAPRKRLRVFPLQMRAATPRRSGLLAAALVALLVVVAAGAAVIYDQSRRERLAPGVRVDGVAVGGLDRNAAEAKLARLAVAPRRRALVVHAGTRTFTVPPERLRVAVDVDAALDRAVADSRRGWLGARVLHGLTGQQVDTDVPLRTSAAPGALEHVASSVARDVGRRARDASVKPRSDGLDVRPSRPGRSVDTVALRGALAVAVGDPRRPADVTADVRPVTAKVTAKDLAQRYRAYIIVDRKAHKLRLYVHLKLADTYDIAVGKAGLETPPGLYDVQWKETNPSWHVPNSAWAGKLAGKTIPPGPDDPIKARWLAFNGGAGIHGIDPSEYGSIGHDASHGCVRMRIPDVIALYGRTPVKSPVYVA